MQEEESKHYADYTDTEAHEHNSDKPEIASLKVNSLITNYIVRC